MWQKKKRKKRRRSNSRKREGGGEEGEKKKSKMKNKKKKEKQQQQQQPNNKQHVVLIEIKRVSYIFVLDLVVRKPHKGPACLCESRHVARILNWGRATEQGAEWGGGIPFHSRVGGLKERRELPSSGVRGGAPARQRIFGILLWGPQNTSGRENSANLLNDVHRPESDMFIWNKNDARSKNSNHCHCDSKTHEKNVSQISGMVWTAIRPNNMIYRMYRVVKYKLKFQNTQRLVLKLQAIVPTASMYRKKSIHSTIGVHGPPAPCPCNRVGFTFTFMPLWKLLALILILLRFMLLQIGYTWCFFFIQWVHCGQRIKW